MINTNLHSISHRFQVIADYWSNLRFRQGVSLLNTLVRSETWTQNHEIWPQEIRSITLSHGIDILTTIISFCHNPQVWHTDRQTDRQNSDRKTVCCIYLHSHGKNDWMWTVCDDCFYCICCCICYCLKFSMHWCFSQRFLSTFTNIFYYLHKTHSQIFV